VDVAKLKEYMDENEIAPATLAKSMGVSRAAVSRVLNGGRGAGTAFIGSLAEAHPDAWDKGIIFLSDRSRKVTPEARPILSAPNEAAR